MSLDYKQLYQQVVSFLIPHEQLWSQEVLHAYPSSLESYPLEWIEELKNLDQHHLWEIDSKQSFQNISTPSLKNLLNDIKILGEQIPHYQSSQQFNYSDRSFFKVKGKKRHEIETITPLIAQLNSTHNYSSLVDIGGGQGHLARIVSSFHNLAGNSIDCNINFQQSGKNKLSKYPNYQSGKKISYILHEFGKNKQADAQLLQHDTITVGLHTCGSLALRHIEAFCAGQAKTIINFGCCYLRMDPQTDTNISKFVRQSTNLRLNKFSLTLATRSHAKMNFEQFKLKQRVKQYRNIFHLLLREKLQLPEFCSVGDSPPRHYWGSFFNYCQEKFKFLNIVPPFTEQEINAFFLCPTNQDIAANMFCADIIRWQFGRPLEIYILLDRLFWLQEQNIKTNLFQLFDEKLSPRNIAIIATK